MAFPVEWTLNALEDYEQVINYLLKEWSITTASNFIQTLKERIFNLSMFPNLGVVSTKDPSIRSILITKHNRLYYSISSKKIIILDIFDTRQDPQKNKY